MKSLVVLTIVRLTLWFTSYKSVLRRIADTQSRSEDGTQLEVLTWAIEKSSRFVPRASCLTQALALRLLAKREGIDCMIRIGVREARGKGLEAHAWVLADDVVILGGRTEKISEFVPIIDL